MSHQNVIHKVIRFLKNIWGCHFAGTLLQKSDPMMAQDKESKEHQVKTAKETTVCTKFNGNSVNRHVTWWTTDSAIR